MSKETDVWLNTQTLIGFTDKRGNAWHHRRSLQGAESNHYAEEIPVDDVLRRLFNFQAESSKIYVPSIASPRAIEAGFAEPYTVVPNKQAIRASDNGHVFGIFADGYQPHQYADWLIDNVASLLSESKGELAIGSVVLLRNRGGACVQIEVPDNIVTKDGVEFRAFIAAATSLDGWLATTYKRCSTRIVCDNTQECAFGEDGQQFRLKHTRHSTLKLGEAREALQIIFDSGAAFEAEIDKLCATRVTDAQWGKVVKTLVPIEEDATKRSVGIAERKRSELDGLWVKDARVTPWKNTAFGVSQAFNTYDQHLATVKGSHRLERVYTNVLSGKTAQADLKVLDVLGAILDKELVAS